MKIQEQKHDLTVADQRTAIKAIVDRGSWTRVQDADLDTCLVEQLSLALLALSSYRGRVCGAHRRIEKLLREARREIREEAIRKATEAGMIVTTVADADYGYGQGRNMGD